ncbi:MAG TPA: terminase large subunit [Pirellulales bacterium]|nr:terminase large subunit [Pirellulales bacterium]
MDSSLLARLASDPAAFRAALQIDTDTGPRRLGECLDAWQRDDFAALDAGWRRVAGLPGDGAKQRAYLERPRGHSKTGDLAVMATWALFAARRQISGVAAAADRDQARLIRDAIAKLVSSNPWLAPIIDVQSYRVVNRRTDSTLEILSADAPSSYGLTPDFIIVDELTHWHSDDLWVSLFSAAAKRAHSMLVIISNAGTGCGSSWQWKIRAAARNDESWYFSFLDGPVASWISQKHLAEQRRLLPGIAFDRLWLNRWTTGAGDALADDDISAAVTRKRPWTQRKSGWVFVGGLDIGLAKDATALVVLGKSVGETRLIERDVNQTAPRALQIARDLGMAPEPPPKEEIERTVPGTGRLRLASVVLWKPGPGRRVDLSAVERSILRVHEHFGLAQLAYDPHQAEYLADRLTEADVPVERVPFSGGNLQAMATSVLDVFGARQIDLYPHEQLLADLRALRVEEKSYGLRLTSPRGPTGHGDCATALALAIHASRSFADPLGDFTIDHDLVY